MSYEENYAAAEQRILMFATFLFIGEVKDREGMVKGLSTYIATLKTERDQWEARARELEATISGELAH